MDDTFKWVLLQFRWYDIWKTYFFNDKKQLELVLLENQSIDIKINISNLEYLEYKEK